METPDAAQGSDMMTKPSHQDDSQLLTGGKQSGSAQEVSPGKSRQQAHRPRLHDVDGQQEMESKGGKGRTADARTHSSLQVVESDESFLRATKGPDPQPKLQLPVDELRNPQVEAQVLPEDAAAAEEKKAQRRRSGLLRASQLVMALRIVLFILAHRALLDLVDRIDQK